MGDKIEAKKIAKDSGLNIVPGFMGTLKNSDEAISMAKSIGFPVIVKAAAGGGGRGMRVVENTEQMKVAYDSARYEAASAFNDGRLFIEKFMTKPRHIEVQVIADMHGNVVCLGERECTIQRYHQKIIEEAPSSFITQSVREEMYNQATLLCKNVGYYSAGTVEFIMDQEMNFYFLEMNTRLQVEHPVTELVTGFDIVEEMIKIAAKKELSFSQKDVKLNGFAIESRIYSEDPSKGFLPSTGRIIEYKEPPKNSNIRIDTGVDAGSEISMFYDSMIA
jgi:propionyl-CoA carboxylase alpha chain